MSGKGTRVGNPLSYSDGRQRGAVRRHTREKKEAFPNRPVRSPARIQPADHMSMDVSYELEPKSTSGARYQSVTTSCE
jgi:hypothetical protein